jgi:hypothetical protein
MTAATQNRFQQPYWNLSSLLSAIIETGGSRSRAAAFFGGACAGNLADRSQCTWQRTFWGYVLGGSFLMDLPVPDIYNSMTIQVSILLLHSRNMSTSGGKST